MVWNRATVAVDPKAHNTQLLLKLLLLRLLLACLAHDVLYLLFQVWVEVSMHEVGRVLWRVRIILHVNALDLVHLLPLF
jgi:hypothetical protein